MSIPTPRLNLNAAKLLLIDDNEVSAELLTQVLTGFGVKKIKSCTKAEDGQNMMRSESFDLILIDSDMSNKDGYSLTRDLRFQMSCPNFTTPVILTSCYTAVDRVIQARDVGANLVLKKPIAPTVLLKRIAWLARNPRSFITTDTYRGPDRRFKNMGLPEGCEERRADSIALLAEPDRALSQGDIDSLFD